MNSELSNPSELNASNVLVSFFICAGMLSSGGTSKNDDMKVITVSGHLEIYLVF